MTAARAAVAAVAARLLRELDEGQVITDRQELRTYECDGLAHYRVVPALVVMARSTADCAAVVRACVEAGVPYVARGSGTGLSGGALPHADGVLLVTSQMRDVLEVAAEDERAVVRARGGQPAREPGRGAARLLLRAGPVVASRSARSGATSRRTPAARTA